MQRHQKRQAGINSDLVVSVKVVRDLHQNTRPVDAVDTAQIIALDELCVLEDVPDWYVKVIRGAFHCGQKYR